MSERAGKPRAERVVPTTAGTQNAVASEDYLTPGRLAWRRFRRSRLGMSSAIVVLLLYFSALFAPFLSPHDPNRTVIDHVHAPPQMPVFWDNGPCWPYVHPLVMDYTEDGFERVYTPDLANRHAVRFFVKGDPYQVLGLFTWDRRFVGTAEGAWYPLGTDRMGRDLLSRMLHGGRISLTIGLVGVAITTFLGTLIGVISGYFGGVIDSVVQRGIELLMSFPAIPLWMALAAALPAHWSPVKIYFGIVTILSLIGWGGLARQVRGMVLSLRERDYIKASSGFGASNLHVMFRHLIPACSGYLIVVATLMIPATILGETALSFLGLGIRPPMTSWGVLLEEAQHIRVLVQFPWLLLPAVPVLLTVVSFNLAGDALRDAIETSTE